MEHVGDKGLERLCWTASLSAIAVALILLPGQVAAQSDAAASSTGAASPFERIEAAPTLGIFAPQVQQGQDLVATAQAAFDRCDRAAFNSSQAELRALRDYMYDAWLGSITGRRPAQITAEMLNALNAIDDLYSRTFTLEYSFPGTCGRSEEELKEELLTTGGTQLSVPICPEEKQALVARQQAAVEAVRSRAPSSLLPGGGGYKDMTQFTEEYDAWLAELDAEKVKLAQIEAMPVKPCDGEAEEELLTIGGLGLKLVQDSGEWCTFGPTAPENLPGGGPKTTQGGGPQTTPGGGPQTTPGGGPQTTPGGGSQTTPGGGPSTVPGGGVFIPDSTPRDEDGGDTRDDGEDEGDPTDEGDNDDPTDEPTVPLVVKATSAAQTGTVQQAVSGQQVKLFAPSQQPQNLALPSSGGSKPQTDASAEPLSCVTGADGSCTIPINRADLGLPEGTKLAASYEVDVSATAVKSLNILVEPGTRLRSDFDEITISRVGFAGGEWITIMNEAKDEFDLNGLKILLLSMPGVLYVEENLCRTKEEGGPNDPHFHGVGAWGQAHDDQWAIKRAGMTEGADSAWTQLGPNPQPVIVAVIDSGLDWNHLDFAWDNLWQNPGEVAGNGVDDDGNGFVDDMIGWDFLGNTNKPWDHDGHGTITAGIIAADSENGVGMAGINPHAKIMVLKALNAFGHSRASYIAQAIKYAADNGARVVNLSVGGPGLTAMEKDAIAYAQAKNVVIVVAAGNAGINVETYGPASIPGVITVGATGLKDEHPNFSNWGPGIDIAAPGVDVLGLRARRTDTVRGIPDVPYVDGEGYVGADKRYYRVSGTSFAAPIVTGIASLLLSQRPELTAAQVENILIQSAEDIQTPGRDNFSGAGMVDARAALGFDPSVRVEAAIAGVEVVQGADGPAVRVNGTIAADRLDAARIEIGAGREPASFRTVAEDLSSTSGALAEIPANDFRTAREWTIRLVVTHANGIMREARFVLDVGG
jgi:subtilisin family serine protease